MTSVFTRPVTEGSIRERLRLQAVARAAGATWRWPYRLPHPPGQRPATQIQIGTGAFVGRDAWVDLSGPDARFVIGAGSVIAGNLMVSCGGRVEIGEGVLFSERVCLLDQVHDYERWLSLPDRPPRFTWDMTPARPVSVGAGSWLGVGVVVLPGVSIGVGCVIGANAVVTSDVPDYTVAGGVPARPIRTISR